MNQFDNSFQYCKTSDHGNADVLNSRLPAGEDKIFDGEEDDNDTDMVCTIHILSLQVGSLDSRLLTKESGKDPVIATVMRYVHEGWPPKQKGDQDEVEKFRKVSNSLSTSSGCLLLGTRVVIPEVLRPQVLELIHLGHFGMEKMKQLARTAVYWPGIDDAIEAASRNCQSCAEHQNKPPKPAIHPWMLPEKPWSRIHIDHTINFMGSNWSVVTDVTSDININTDAEITVVPPDHPMDLVEDLQPVSTAPQFQVPDPEYGPNNPRSFKRTHKPRQKMNL